MSFPASPCNVNPVRMGLKIFVCRKKNSLVVSSRVYYVVVGVISDVDEASGESD